MFRDNFANSEDGTSYPQCKATTLVKRKIGFAASHQVPQDQVIFDGKVFHSDARSCHPDTVGMVSTCFNLKFQPRELKACAPFLEHKMPEVVTCPMFSHRTDSPSRFHEILKIGAQGKLFMLFAR